MGVYASADASEPALNIRSSGFGRAGTGRRPLSPSSSAHAFVYDHTPAFVAPEKLPMNGRLAPMETMLMIAPGRPAPTIHRAAARSE